MFFVWSCSCLCSIHWSQVLSREWRCSWISADWWCSNYIWVINNFIAYEGVTYIRGLTVCTFGIKMKICESGFLGVDKWLLFTQLLWNIIIYAWLKCLFLPHKSSYQRFSTRLHYLHHRRTAVTTVLCQAIDIYFKLCYMYRGFIEFSSTWYTRIIFTICTIKSMHAFVLKIHLSLPPSLYIAMALLLCLFFMH